MMEKRRYVIPATGVRSLCWSGERLVDWVGGGVVYGLDGSKTGRPVSYAFPFDAAVTAPSGRYAVIYKRLGTKGLVLDRGKILREINRSFYHAHVYDYPVTLFALPDGREVIAHCPEDYCRLDIEELDSGKLLTPRQAERLDDFFHSRLAVNPSGTRLLSAGWIWTPIDSISLYEIPSVLADPALLDKLSAFPPRPPEINNAAFLDADILVVASSKEAFDFMEGDEDRDPLTPGSIGVYDLQACHYRSIAPLEENVGMMMPVDPEHVVGFYECPKLIQLSTGRVIHRWPELKVGTQDSSISRNVAPHPPLALDPMNRRFAVADEAKITVVALS